MTLLSLFDVLGPIMVGPSSSHTAGATRIGWLVRHIAGRTPSKIVLGFHQGLMQTYKGHSTDSGLVAGLLGYREDDAHIRTALDDASRLGIPVSVELIGGNGHPNEMRCNLVLDDGSTTCVTGISIGGGSVIISDIDGVPVSLDGSTGGLLIWHTSSALAESLDCQHTSPPLAESIDRDVAHELPKSLVEYLAGVGFWTRGLATGNAPNLAISFVHGPSDPGENVVREVAERWAGEGVVRCQWVPGLGDQKVAPEKRSALFASSEEYIRIAGQAVSGSTPASSGLPLAAIRYEQGLTGLSTGEVRAKMAAVMLAMKESVRSGLEDPLHLVGGFLPGDDGKRVWGYAGASLGGTVLSRAMARALAVAEVNASQGKVVASPTAGSCGVLPGVVLSVAEHIGAGDDALIDALLVASAIGVIIGRTASFSGAVGGCQAEVGIASAMAAAAGAYMGKGSPEVVLHAAAMAIKNTLGLACDPAAGPVEVPCIKRNAGGVAIAIASADMALAGVRSAIPFDEVILALKNVQDLMHEDLRDNTLGGLGCTPTSARMKAEWASRFACEGCRR